MTTSVDFVTSLNVPEVYVQNSHGDEHGQGYQDHGKKQIFAQQGHGKRCRWNDLNQEQEEHGE